MTRTMTEAGYTAHQAKHGRNQSTKTESARYPAPDHIELRPQGAMIGRIFDLPYPPSTNTYWRHIGVNRTVLSQKARAYRKTVMALIGPRKPNLARLEVVVRLYPPDKRRRDLDNVTKALFDSLQHAAVFKDDEQIDQFTVIRGRIVKGGHCSVTILDMDQ